MSQLKINLFTSAEITLGAKFLGELATLRAEQEKHYPRIEAHEPDTPAEEPVVEKPKRTAKGTAAAEKTEPAASPTTADSEPAATAAATKTEKTSAGTGKKLTFDDDVAPAFLDLVKVKGKATARKVILHFQEDAPETARLSQIIQPEQFAEAIEVIGKLKAEA